MGGTNTMFNFIVLMVLASTFFIIGLILLYWSIFLYTEKRRRKNNNLPFFSWGEKIFYIIGSLAMIFLFGFYLFSWQEPYERVQNIAQAKAEHPNCEVIHVVDKSVIILLDKENNPIKHEIGD